MKHRVILVFILIIVIVTIVVSIIDCDESIKEPIMNESVVSESVIKSTVIEPTIDIQPSDNPQNLHSHISCDWDSEDSYLLMKIAMAEAEGEDIEGKAYVMMVVLNRVKSDEFPNTVRDVIFEKKQFSPISNGRYDRVEPNEECYEALRMVMVDKWDKSQGALYFESNKDPDNWHSRNLEYLYTHGCHRFYK
jgi:N-acetylmuramoyl-L-alanine amidase